jgi:two-component system, OmpR family, phosphate regulon sensor histidine kinase PhoR
MTGKAYDGYNQVSKTLLCGKSPMSVTLDSTLVFLNRLATPAVLLQLGPTGLSLAAANTAWCQLRDGPLNALPEPTLAAYLFADIKAGSPLLSNAGPQAGQPIQAHTALFETAQGQRVRVKVKGDWLDESTLVVWIEPFSEDMALIQAHADFVSTVSHEFRTPLTSIKGFADTLLRYGETLETEQQRRFISIIKHQADRLTRLVENLLTVSKLGAQKTGFTLRPIRLKDMLERVIQSVEGKLTDTRHFVTTIAAELPDVWADPDKLEQVLLNLIDNAAKYSYANTTVTINAQQHPTNADRLVITITDEGVGIPASHLPNLFNKFSRIDNPLTRQVEGTGLGLYITKALTTAMGGEISVDSIAEKGTTFTLSFPVATPERQAAQTGHANPLMEAGEAD